MKVLVVDDVVANLKMMQRLLTMHHFEVITQSNPSKALSILEEDPSIRVVLVDYVMPEMKGSDFIKAVQSLKIYKTLGKALIPTCILITAWAQEFTIGNALNLGFYAVLKKPFPNNHLIELLEEISSGSFRNSRNILFINFDINDRSLLSKIFSSVNYKFQFSPNYDHALHNYISYGNVSSIVARDECPDDGQFARFTSELQRFLEERNSITAALPPILIATTNHNISDSLRAKLMVYQIINFPLEYKNIVNVIREIHKEEVNKKILVAGDIGLDLTFLEKLFNKWHYDLLISNTAEDSMDILTSNKGADICIVLCDVMTSKVNGYELFNNYKMFEKALSKEYVNQELPFVMVTDIEHEDLARKAFSEGVKEIIRKPININKLKRAMENVIEPA